MLDEVVQVLVGLQPFDRSLRAAFVDARNVVHLVPHQGKVVDDLLRGDAELFHHTFAVHPGLGHGIDQGDVVADQLRHVLVTGGDHHVDALAGGFVGQGADNVVGFHLGHDQQGQAHGPDNLVDRFDLHCQVIRHRGAVGLVLFIHLVPEGFALGIKDHHHFRARKILLQATDHTDHTLDGPGRVILAVGQRRQRVVGAEKIGRAVDEHHGWGLFFIHRNTDPDSD